MFKRKEFVAKILSAAGFGESGTIVREDVKKLETLSNRDVNVFWNWWILENLHYPAKHCQNIAPAVNRG
jgi:hypothetical protein